MNRPYHEPPQDTHDRGVSSMFGRIVKWYDPLNRLLSLGCDQRWRRILADAVLTQDRPSYTESLVLDLAAGTLDVSLALRNRYPGLRVAAMDFCFPMLQHGLPKLHTSENTINVWPVTADARHLPLPDACADGITMAFGIRNILPRSEAFCEMARVLRPGARACILEFGTGKQRIFLGIYNVYLKYILPFLGRLSGNADAYAYLARTICDFPDAQTLSSELHTAGFARVYHTPLCFGIVRLHVAEKAKEHSVSS